MAHPYEVAIHLTAHNGVSGVLATISKEVLGLNASVATLQKGLSNLRLGVLGALSLGAGIGGLKAMESLVDKGNAWVKVSRDMAQAGATNEQVMRAQAEAIKLTGTYANMSSVEIMKMQNDARMTFGSQDLATEHIRPYVEMASFLKAYEGHEKGSKDSEGLMREINAAMKSGEIAGKISPHDMEEHIKQLAAMKVAYGEQVKIAQYLAAQRTGGVALRNTSDEFRYGMFPALVQEQGSSAGVMLMTAFNKVVAGVGNRTASLQRMQEIGLLNEEQIKYDKAGRAIGLKDPSGIKGSEDAAMNFGNWVMTTLKPLLEKKLDDSGITDKKERDIREAQLISGMFPDRNAAKAITEVLQQFTKLSKDAEQMARARAAMNMGQYNAGSWDYQVESFKTQWNNLMTHLGAPMVEGATRALARLNEAMAGMSRWAMANPEKVKMMGVALTALSAGLAALGVVLIGTALAAALGPGGWLVAGIAAIAAAVAALAYLSGPMDKAKLGLNGPQGPQQPMQVGTGGFGLGGPQAPQAAKQWSAGDFVKYWTDVGAKISAAMKATGEIMDAAGMKVYNAISSIREAFASLPAKINEIGSMMSSAIAALPGQVSGAISAAFAAIGAAISNAVKGLVNFGKVAPGDGPGSRDGAAGDVGSRLSGGQKRSQYVPPAGGTTGTQRTAMLMDGRVVGHIVEQRMARNNEHAAGSNDFDPRGGFTPVDIG